MKTLVRFFVIIAGICLLSFCSLTSQSQDHWWEDWTKNFFNPVVGSGPDTWFYHVLPSTVIHENDTYRMWFSGWDSNTPIRRIGYAESNDGISWDIYPFPVFQGATWDAQIYIGTVLRVNDTLRMWYTGFTSISTFDAQIGYAWSIDGYSWIRHSEPVLTAGEPGFWDDELVMGPRVIYNGETYHMYYDDAAAIGHATSSDGIDWIKDENNPILMTQPNTFYNYGVFSGGTILYNDTIHMWFGGRNSSITDRIGYGYSTDYSTFTWSADTAMDRGPMAWDYAGVSDASILVADGKYRMWYSGSPSTVHFMIGTAAGPEAACVPVYFNGCEDGHGFNDFALNEIENYNSGCGSMDGTGYSRYLELGPAEVLPGETYTLTISSNHDMQYATVWVDWNGNMEYEEDEMVIDNFIMEQAGVSYEVDFVVPSSIERLTEYPMRARTNYNDSCNDPCRNYYFGETEDYMLAYPVGVDESAVGSQQSAVRVWPNPTSGSSQFAVHSSQSEHVTIKIYDLHGREVATVVDQQLPAGEHTVNYDASHLPPGVYICRKSAVSTCHPERSEGPAVGKLIIIE
jgi:predicted GH43/DUF377 family glycosyl hydrolase